MKAVICPECNQANPGSKLHCAKCGASLIGLPLQEQELDLEAMRVQVPEPVATEVRPTASQEQAREARRMQAPEPVATEVQPTASQQQVREVVRVQTPEPATNYITCPQCQHSNPRGLERCEKCRCSLDWHELKPLGEPFKAKFKRYANFRAFNEPGAAQFQDEHLSLRTRLPRVSGPIGVILVVAYYVLLGSLWGRLFDRLVLVEKVATVPYEQIVSVLVAKQTLSLTVQSSVEPEIFEFRISANDKERLHRELFQRFPDKVSEWECLLQ